MRNTYVNTRVNADLVHDSDARVLALLVKLQHGRRDVARGNDMLLLPDGTLDDGGVEGVGDKRDDQVVLGYLRVEGLVIIDIERDGMGVFNTLRELLGALKGPTGCRGVNRERPESYIMYDVSSKSLPMVTSTPFSLRMSRVGFVTKPAPSMRTFLYIFV